MIENKRENVIRLYYMGDRVEKTIFSKLKKLIKVFILLVVIIGSVSFFMKTYVDEYLKKQSQVFNELQKNRIELIHRYNVCKLLSDLTPKEQKKCENTTIELDKISTKLENDFDIFFFSVNMMNGYIYLKKTLWILGV